MMSTTVLETCRGV